VGYLGPRAQKKGRTRAIGLPCKDPIGWVAYPMKKGGQKWSDLLTGFQGPKLTASHISYVIVVSDVPWLEVRIH